MKLSARTSPLPSTLQSNATTPNSSKSYTSGTLASLLPPNPPNQRPMRVMPLRVMTSALTAREHAKQVHLKERNHPCTEKRCIKRCSSKSNLKLHINRLHKGLVKVWKCTVPMCTPMEFAQHSQLFLLGTWFGAYSLEQKHTAKNTPDYHYLFTTGRPEALGVHQTWDGKVDVVSMILLRPV